MTTRNSAERPSAPAARIEGMSWVPEPETRDTATAPNPETTRAAGGAAIRGAETSSIHDHPAMQFELASPADVLGADNESWRQYLEDDTQPPVEAKRSWARKLLGLPRKAWDKANELTGRAMMWVADQAAKRSDKLQAKLDAMTPEQREKYQRRMGMVTNLAVVAIGAALNASRLEHLAGSMGGSIEHAIGHHNMGVGPAHANADPTTPDHPAPAPAAPDDGYDMKGAVADHFFNMPDTTLGPKLHEHDFGPLSQAAMDGNKDGMMKNWGDMFRGGNGGAHIMATYLSEFGMDGAPAKPANLSDPSVLAHYQDQVNAYADRLIGDSKFRLDAQKDLMHTLNGAKVGDLAHYPYHYESWYIKNGLADYDQNVTFENVPYRPITLADGRVFLINPDCGLQISKALPVPVQAPEVVSYAPSQVAAPHTSVVVAHPHAPAPQHPVAPAPESHPAPAPVPVQIPQTILGFQIPPQLQQIIPRVPITPEHPITPPSIPETPITPVGPTPKGDNYVAPAIHTGPGALTPEIHPAPAAVNPGINTEDVGGGHTRSGATDTLQTPIQAQTGGVAPHVEAPAFSGLGNGGVTGTVTGNTGGNTAHLGGSRL